MSNLAIHKSGQGGDKLVITSYYNGTAYSAAFGEAGSPMRNLFFQDDYATQLMDEFNKLETAYPNEKTRKLWMLVLEPYL